jgi:heme exporter protein D
MSEFLAMGGYAQWVWSAFGLAVAVLIYNYVAARRRYQRVLIRLALQAARSGRRDET